MKKINKKISFPVLALLLMIGFSSCLDDLNIAPVNPNVSSVFYQDEVFAKIYSSLALTGQKGPDGLGDVVGIDEGTSAFVRLVWNLNELTTDEAICSWGDPGIPEMNFNKWSSSHSNIKGLYGRFYFNITLINEFLTKTEGMTDAKTLKQRAEARFMRALNYYYLMDMFGNVPFVDKVTIAESPNQIKRADLFNYIIKELSQCENDMYEPGESKSYYRINKVANWLLRSRAYLNAEVYTGTAKWDSAAMYAKKVIDPSSGYSLCPTYRHLFMADNAGIFDGSTVNQAPNEIIFPIAADGVQTKSWGTSLFLIASTHTGDMPSWGTTEGWAGNRARSTLVKKFFPGNLPKFTDDNDLTTARLPVSLKDARALFLKGGIKSKLDPSKDSTSLRTLGIISNTFKEGFSVIKYSNLRADGAKTNDIQFTDTDVPLMRQAEAYLNYAEALTRGAAPIDSYTALEAINTIRRRAGKTTDLTSLSEQNIIDEWAREFFFEGRRRMDLIRFGQYGGANTGYTWELKHEVPAGEDFSADFNLFPIPVSEINANPNLKQNTGY
ncbi:MAG: RagB/SusD family nutrient uptake outer membrane protein [Porphyromonadaceae bacterium CG2_30_38_12]|nr:MAG: RagB/SusD family nutrient uptake outer membrane protein [Porphyromonadaceae bacterium CG2_30_38_12]